MSSPSFVFVKIMAGFTAPVFSGEINVLFIIFTPLTAGIKII